MTALDLHLKPMVEEEQGINLMKLCQRQKITSIFPSHPLPAPHNFSCLVMCDSGKKKRLWFIFILWFPCTYHDTYPSHCSKCSVSFLNFKHCSHGCITYLFYYTSHSWAAGLLICLFSLPSACLKEKGKYCGLWMLFFSYKQKDWIWKNESLEFNENKTGTGLHQYCKNEKASYYFSSFPLVLFFAK